jgi:predicted nucleic acid-binding protein
MILIDTNVVSETMRAAPERMVIDWLDSQAIGTLCLSAVSLAELLCGIAELPEGRRKAGLGKVLNEQVELLFGQRILAFDASAAHGYATAVTRARRAGRPIGLVDAQIAAIAAAHGFAVATRDTTPFEAAGIRVFNPWTSGRHS